MYMCSKFAVTCNMLLYMQQYEFKKVEIPKEIEKRVDLSKKLGKYNVSLTQYNSALRLPEIIQ